MPEMNRMRDAAREKYGEELETVMPRLMEDLKKPVLVARDLGVYPNAARNWLLRNGWIYDGKEWVKVVEHA